MQRLDAGLPRLNVQRPKGVTAADQKLKFQFKHALAQLNIQIDADPDLTAHNETDTLQAGTKVYVRSITLGGIASKGSLNLNNIVANEPLWQSYYGSGSIYAETATITDGRRDGKEGVAGKVMGVVGSLYSNVTGYFSDILSYSRLMALMLAGAVIAQVFNTIGSITGNVVAFFIIAMLGNALNFALNLLGCYVHDMRLQCLEFFGRFYEDGGRPFKPLELRAKYVDIVEN